MSRSNAFVSGGGINLTMNPNNPSSGQSSNSNATLSANPTSVPSINSSRVFIQRDYRQGVAIRFATEFPAELSGRIDQMTFEYTIDKINSYFEEAEGFNCSSLCESCLTFLSVNMLHLCKDTRYEKCLKQVQKFIIEQNSHVYIPSGLHIVNPLERGLRCIEIAMLSDSPNS